MINDLWYKNAVIYCLSVATFMDANGDGVGDFKGLMRRLDYLQGLGVTAIWLMPFQPSPCRDDGYDIKDYYNVDPAYGTLGDFVEFTRGCEQRGMRVLIDLVVNHTSNEHPWFQQARRDPKSKYRDWYVWSKKKPAHSKDGVVFPGVQQTTWSHDEVAKQWYFHRFYDFQPDLNTANPEVQAEILKVMGFWIQLGVSGFRMDAVPFVIAEKGPKAAKQPREQYEMLREFREFLSWRKGDAVILAEANVQPNTDMEYFGDTGERLHMMFNFQVNQNLFYALASADSRPLIQALKKTKSRPATAQWGQFLRNHDELDLGRLTDEQREKVFEAFGPEPEMQLYERGIRRRLAPMLNGDRKRLELAYSLMMTLPGTPVIRYGDEIGMGDDLRLPERDCARTPMQWSLEPNGGFTSSEKPNHVIKDGPYGYQHVNAAEQRRDPNSLLNWMERIIRMRKEVPEIGWGDFTTVKTGANDVLGICYHWRENYVLLLHNLSPSPREIRFALSTAQDNSHLVNLLADAHSHADKAGKHCVLLEPYGYRWFRVGNLRNVQTQSDA